jgi:lysozyme
MNTLQTTTNNFTVCGIDISKFQGNEINQLNKQTDQLTFIICKATEGITYTDPDFKTNWPMIQSKGYVRGAYHF